MLLYRIESCHVDKHRTVIVTLPPEMTHGAGEKKGIDALHKRRGQGISSLMKWSVAIFVLLRHPAVTSVLAGVVFNMADQRKPAMSAIRSGQTKYLCGADVARRCR